MEKWAKFFGNGWTETLEDFLSSDEFESIGRYLIKERKEGKIVAPNDKVIFRAFKECSWNKVTTVILGAEPYNGKIDEKLYLSDGLAFSAKHAKIPPRQLQMFRKGIDEEIYKGDGRNLGIKNDLTFLANQGVLLLNCALTSINGIKGGHIFLWNRFIQYVLEQISENKEEIVFILMGGDAIRHKSMLIKTNNVVYTCEHPTEAINRGGKWSSNGVFKAANAFHELMEHDKINWSERTNDSDNEFAHANSFDLGSRFL